jgi:hypothetical protein
LQEEDFQKEMACNELMQCFTINVRDKLITQEVIDMESEKDDDKPFAVPLL